MEKQERVFLAQLKIARETDMPIVIHCRNAEIEVFEILVKVLVYFIHSKNSHF